MADRLDIEELRRLSDWLRAAARRGSDSGLKIKMAEAALTLAEIAEAMSGNERRD